MKTFLSFLLVYFLLFNSSVDEYVDVKCMVEMLNYRGEGAYIAISIIDKSEKYIKTVLNKTTALEIEDLPVFEITDDGGNIIEHIGIRGHPIESNKIRYLIYYEYHKLTIKSIGNESNFYI